MPEETRVGVTMVTWQLTCLKQHWLIALATDLSEMLSLCRQPPSSSVTSDAGHFTWCAAAELPPRKHDAVVTSCFSISPAVSPAQKRQVSFILLVRKLRHRERDPGHSWFPLLAKQTAGHICLSSQATSRDLHLEDNIPRVSIIPLSANQHKLLQ